MYNVRVPATSANIGSGFDTIGAAFKLYNTFQFAEQDNGKLTIRGVKKKYQNKHNLVYQAMLRVFARTGYKPAGIFINEQTEIPVGRGLGSSATCIAAGLVGANAICGGPLAKRELLEIAVEMEGHPDNVAPALYGGLTTSLMTPKRTLFIKDTIHPVFNFYACIPNFKLPTVKARAVLPTEVPRADAVFDISHANMTYLALTRGLADYIPHCLADRLHEPYRRKLISHSKDVTARAKRYGALATYISGAGPTLMIVTEAKNVKFEARMHAWMFSTLPHWQFRRMLPERTGTTVRERN